jgi:hypothetical protein
VYASSNTNVPISCYRVPIKMNARNNKRKKTPRIGNSEK